MSTRTTPDAAAPRWGTLEDAAEHLSVNPRTIRRLIADGTITGYRLGARVIRVDLNQVDALLRPIPSANAGSVA